MESAVRCSGLEFGMKQQQVLGEELWPGNGGSGDDFCVDELLNLNDEGIGEDGLTAVEATEAQNDKDENTSFLLTVTEQMRQKEAPVEDFGSAITVPADEADLEWLSHFMEDSFSQFSTPYPPASFSSKPRIDSEPEPGPGPGPDSSVPVSFPVQTGYVTTRAFTKARRSRRARSGGRVWSFGSPSLAADSTTSTTTTTTTTTSSSSSTLSFPPSPPYAFLVFNPEPVTKKQKTRPPGGVGSGSAGNRQARICSHCGVQKTPQWRTGPMGAKTLCNACGVRYKSGRLLPEYRPACSPTFSTGVHSNNHRKVLEMRKKKEPGRPESGFAHHPVASFG